MKRLPPLKTLEGFDAAARLGSFAAAAEALGLTQSAISHQIRLLEQTLGQPLFRRLHRRVALTDPGRDFHRTVRAVLQGLRDGVNRLEPYRKPGSVIVYCQADITHAWLAPRLPQFHASHPQIDMWLDTSDRDIDFDRDEVDILIRQVDEGEEGFTGPSLRVETLFDQSWRPIGPPAMADTDAAALARRLTDLPLLHVEGDVDWQDWYGKVVGEVDDALVERLMRGTNFSDPYSMLRCAAAGGGVGLADPVFASTFLADGSLAWLSDIALPSRSRIIMAAPRERLERRTIHLTFEWLILQAARTRMAGSVR